MVLIISQPLCYPRYDMCNVTSYRKTLSIWDLPTDCNLLTFLTPMGFPATSELLLTHNKLSLIKYTEECCMVYI